MSDAPAVRLRGNPYARPDYFRTDVEKGVTRTPAGTRVCALPSEFLLGFREAIEYECGRAAPRVLQGAGRKWGALFARRFADEVKAVHGAAPRDLPAAVAHVALAEAFAAHGYGRLTVDLSAIDHGAVVCELSDSVMPALVRESAKPVDNLMAGLLAAVFTDLAGEELGAVQTDCPSRGAATSKFVLCAAGRADGLAKWLEESPEPVGHAAALRRLTGGHT